MTRDADVKRILYALHMGLVEIRRLARAAEQEQIASLADVLEIIPTECLEGSLQSVETHFAPYTSRYDSVFDYHAILQGKEMEDQEITRFIKADS